MAISLTIDNKKIQAPEGQKILAAALEHGIDIPHLCYHPELKAFGGCRLCLVEVKGEPHLVSSCVSPVEEGMEVHTSTPRIQRARRSIVQLLLLNHPLDCLVCERGGDCRLQKLAFDLEVQPDKYKMKKRIVKGRLQRGILEIDPKKCIHCGLCVRVCKELQYVGAIDFFNRGFKTEIGIPFDDESLCALCGQCLEVCPVAGVVGLDAKYIARPWELSQVHTICPYCGTGCLITLNTKDNKVVKINSEDKSGVNEGRICVKGRFGYGFINSSDRLTTPLIKKGDQLQPVSWKEAISYTADRLKQIIEKHGSQAVGGLGSVKCTNEDNYLLQKFLRAVVGTNNIDNYSRMEHSPTLCGLSKTLGIVTMNNTLDQIDSADLIFVIGSHPTDTLPIVSLKIRAVLKSGKSKLIVADPRKIKLAPLADQWLCLKPGTDLALLGGLMHIILNEPQINHQSLNNDTQGFEEFRQSLEKYRPERVAKITGIPEEELIKAAKNLAQATNLAILYSSGLTQHVWGTQNVTALADLFLLTGHADKEHSGIYPLRSHSNDQGACDMGTLPDYLPGYQRVDDPQIREKFEQAWGAKLPPEPGLTSTQMVKAMQKGELKALYIMGDNPSRYYPHAQDIKQALSSLELLVVQDLFLSETAKLADVVFPATSFAERAGGTTTNMERKVQLLAKAISSPGKALPDWKIISELSTKMGYPMHYSLPREIMKEINGLVPIYGGISYQRLRSGGLHWPCPNKTHPGTKLLPPHWECGTKASFAPLPPTPIQEKKDIPYPFKLIIGGTLFHSGGGTLSMKSKILRNVCPHGSVALNPQDAANLGISDDDMVRITSHSGSIEVTAKLLPLNPAGIVFLPKQFEELPSQRLMSGQLDPISHIPAMKVCAVSLTKI